MAKDQVDPETGETWLPLAKVARLLRRSSESVKIRALQGEFDLRVTGTGRYYISRTSAMSHIAEMEERTDSHG